MTNKLAGYLLSARSALRMDVKTVAMLNRMSDKTLTRLEQVADIKDPTVEMLIAFYRRHGIEFVTKKGQIDAMRISDGVREGTIVFDKKALDENAFYSLPGALRSVMHLVLKPTLVDKRKGAPKDAYRFSLPSDDEKLFSELMVEWIRSHGPLTFINAQNQTMIFDTSASAASIASFISS